MFSHYVLRWLHAWGYILEFDMYYRIHIKGEDSKFFTAQWVNNHWFIDTSHDIALFNDAEFIRYLGYEFNMHYDDVDESIINWCLFNKLDISPSWGPGIKIENKRTGLTVILNYFGTEGYTVHGDVSYTNIKQGEVIKLLGEQLNVHS